MKQILSVEPKKGKNKNKKKVENTKLFDMSKSK